MKPEDALKQVGLGHKINEYPAELSGGEQQRVAIARALVKQTGLLLCDEPTGALDYESGKRVLRIIEGLVRQKKQTVVVVTHTQAIAAMADRVIKMRRGRIGEISKNPNPVSSERVQW